MVENIIYLKYYLVDICMKEKNINFEYVVLNLYCDMCGIDLSILNYILSIVSRVLNLIIGIWNFVESL